MPSCPSLVFRELAKIKLRLLDIFVVRSLLTSIREYGEPLKRRRHNKMFGQAIKYFVVFAMGLYPIWSVYTFSLNSKATREEWRLYLMFSFTCYTTNSASKGVTGVLLQIPRQHHYLICHRNDQSAGFCIGLLHLFKQHVDKQRVIEKNAIIKFVIS
jgi:nitrate reductase NapE component